MPYTSELKIIINADDLGMSREVNQAIIKAHCEGALNSASIMVTAPYFEEALLLVKQQAPKLEIGLHCDLIFGKAVSHKDTALSDTRGNFRYGFIGLLLWSMLTPPHRVLRTLYREVLGQIDLLQANLPQGKRISHIDGHRHIQMIPMFGKVIWRISRRYQIERMRIINENPWHTLFHYQSLAFLWNGGLFKLILLMFLRFLGSNYGMSELDRKKMPYHFSILHSCEIDCKAIRNWNGFCAGIKEKSIEIMLHPSLRRISAKDDTGVPEYSELKHLSSPSRQTELQSALDFASLLGDTKQQS